ncbi:hypothetical protein BBK14_01665 [Parafrankia soli]|uniref:HEAT repeat domain-containing protein n=1 Tax=Parafrankia soli TaxID=2599596 RepID=A0A1S1RKE6_9ACTN|nr:HEAT repeat domain-containing protein [Parafrankia soli]OHV46660.1 hypothetical protein BBK14_01665 [Parafrankia soli]
MGTDFERAMHLMRRRDPQSQEDGFAWLQARASQHLDQLIVEFQRESDHGLRCWLLELIGHARSLRALPLLIEQLASQDDSLRAWAATGLRRLDSPDGRRAIYQARTNGQIDQVRHIGGDAHS